MPIHLQVSVTDPTSILVGGVFNADADSTNANVLVEVAVQNGGSAPFDVPGPGAYRYEFNIHGGGKFTLSLVELPGNTPVKVAGNPFDPADPGVKSPTMDRKAFFVV